MGPARAARAGLVRDLVGSLVVLGVVAFTAVGLPIIDRSLPAGQPVAARVPYRVGANVTVTPPAGATLDVTRTRPGDDRGTALFLVNDVRLALVVVPFRGTLDEAARRLHVKITRVTGLPVAGSDRPTYTDQGVVGRRGSYSSPGRVGEYAVLVSSGVSVEVTASGPEQRPRELRPTMETSLRSVVFGAS